jgi:hypothetical protein
VREPNLTQSHAGRSVLLTSCLRNFGTASLSLSLSLCRCALEGNSANLGVSGLRTPQGKLARDGSY